MSDPWSNAEAKLLKDSLDDFRACKGETRGKARTKIVNNVLRGIIDLYDDPSPQLQRQLKERVKGWYNTYGRTRTSREVFRLWAKYSERDVHMYNHRDRIDMALKARSLVRGSGDYLAAFQTELTEVIRGLPDAERRSAEAEAKTWSKRAPPRDVQAKNARTKSKKYIGGFAQQIWQQSGMYAVVVTHHKDEKGDVQYLVHDFGAEVCGLSLEDSSPDWQSKPIIDGLVDHATKMYSEPSGENTELKGSRGKAIKIVLQHDDRGFPRLPPAESVQDLPSKKALIRAYVHAAYCFAAGRMVKHAPWAAILERQNELIDPMYLNPEPEASTSTSQAPMDEGQFVILRDPSKMRDAQITSLVNHWYAREADPECEWTFRFKAYAGKTENFEAVDIPVHPPLSKPCSEDNGLGKAKPSGSGQHGKGKSKGKGKEREKEAGVNSVEKGKGNGEDLDDREGGSEDEMVEKQKNKKSGTPKSTRSAKGKGKGRDQEHMNADEAGKNDPPTGSGKPIQPKPKPLSPRGSVSPEKSSSAEEAGHKADGTGEGTTPKKHIPPVQESGSPGGVSGRERAGMSNDKEDNEGTGDREPSIVSNELGPTPNSSSPRPAEQIITEVLNSGVSGSTEKSVTGSPEATTSRSVDKELPSNRSALPLLSDDSDKEGMDARATSPLFSDDDGHDDYWFHGPRTSPPVKPSPFGTPVRQKPYGSRVSRRSITPDTDLDEEDDILPGLTLAEKPLPWSSSTSRVPFPFPSAGQTFQRSDPGSLFSGPSISSASSHRRQPRRSTQYADEHVREFWEGLNNGTVAIESLKDEGPAQYEPTPSPVKKRSIVSFNTEVEVKNIPGPVNTRARTRAMAEAEAKPPAKTYLTRKKVRDTAQSQPAPQPSKPAAKGKPRPKLKSGPLLQTDEEEMDARSARIMALAKARSGKQTRHR